MSVRDQHSSPSLGWKLWSRPGGRRDPTCAWDRGQYFPIPREAVCVPDADTSTLNSLRFLLYVNA